MTDSTLEQKPIRTATAVKVPRLGTLSRTIKYLFSRILAIALTIYIGVFITVVLANQGGQLDSVMQTEVENKLGDLCGSCVGSYFFQQLSPADQARVTQMRQGLETAAGLNLPYWPRQALWSLKALTLDWPGTYFIHAAPGSRYPTLHVQDIILTDLPHTLLLVATAYLVLFAVGLPLALLLYRNQGSRLDRLFALLAPLSSIPSWVFGLLLILIFAARLRILPISGMYDAFVPEAPLARTGMVLRHMVLPVAAILASLFFQYVYTWRTLFMLYADEDYVELAKAKGLPNKDMERKYIVRPTLPYIITNFALVLITFWQMTVVLEKVFNWPGIGRLYIITLPNFFGDQMYPGVMPITLGIVVLFAYILGITVLILDIVYALVDPRVRIGDAEPTLRPPRKRSWMRFWRRSPRQTFSRPALEGLPGPVPATHRSLGARTTAAFAGLRRGVSSVRGAWRELSHYPSAIVGLAMLMFLAFGSLYAVIAFPYNQLGQRWYLYTSGGKNYVPKLANPTWINWFRSAKLPPTLILDSQVGGADRSVAVDQKGTVLTTITYTLDYRYGEFPQNMILYFSERQGANPTFITMSWVTPDGREIDLGRTSAASGRSFDFLQNFPGVQLRAGNKNWKGWTGSDLKAAIAPLVGPQDRLPAVYLLFADPGSSIPKVVPGTYKLQIKGIGFDKEADLNAQLVVLGQVYGVAGTDIRGRDLLLPLVWGMPFALIFGLLGALVTTVLSICVAGAAVWLGGGVDNFIQRLVEANMILPVIAIGVLLMAYFDVSIWVFLGLVVLLNAFGSPTKAFRAAFLQLKNAPYLEAARAYGASDTRIVLRYLVPRMTPILIPQLVILIPSYVFLEATLGFFNIKSIYPTWGSIIYDALRYGTNYGSSFWVLEPIALLLLTAVAFALLGTGLERILNPRMRQG